MALKTSSQGKALIQYYEGFRPASYQCEAGVWTIGYGTTRIAGVPVKKGMFCTQAEAIGYLTLDLAEAEDDVTRLTNGPMGPVTDQDQFDALVCFTYNVGGPALGTSTLLKRVKARLAVAEKNFTDWNKVRVKGVLQPSPGLTRRRKSEFWLFTTGQIKTTF